MLYNISTEKCSIQYTYLMEIIPSNIIPCYCLDYESHNNIEKHKYK